MLTDSGHLNKVQMVNQGSYYTPEKLVNLVYQYLQPYLNKDIKICDLAAGNGAFIDKFYDYKTLAVDIDDVCIEYLKDNYPKTDIIKRNSLKDVSRENFLIENEEEIIIVGNPPYNDITSQNKQKIKDKTLICDDDLISRDMGVSFLKLYDKLDADIICVLHPLSYLIKKANFNLLKQFRENYRLEKGLIFSSAKFAETTGAEFPIVISLYKKNKSGMTYDDILNFDFDVLNTNKKFKLINYKTSDGVIHKYPNKNKDIKTKVFFQTFRDINSIKRNATFRPNKTGSSILVSLDEFYKYCYLDAFKNLFDPENMFLYANLSPLIPGDFEEENNIKDYVLYSLKTNKVLKDIIAENPNILDNIIEHYKINLNSDIDEITSRLSHKINGLADI